MMKKSKAPCGPRCKPCVLALRTAYPFMELDMIKTRIEASQTFDQEVRAVLARAQGTLEKSFPPQEHMWQEMRGHMIYKDYLCLSADQFESHFGETPDKLGMTVEKFVSDR